ncbi:MAG: EamA family transporter [Acetobacteraceae bacterium]|nr:EamA family transporter [Acetobacteraceae bacterium]
MPLWIPITVAAALFQCWRTAKQQKLRHLLSINGAGFVRFLYGAPAALLFLVASIAASGGALPTPSWAMLAYAAAGGFCQILATNLLIMAFGFRNFAVGTAYAKTEAAQTALIALIVLHETLRPPAWAGIAVGLFGVLTLSLAGRGLRPRDLARGTMQPAAVSGLAAGFLFALTAVLIKLASQSVTAPDVFLRALFVLFVTNALQTLMQGAYLAVRDPSELRKAITSWRSSSLVGLLSAAGSACWFTAFAMTEVALVRSVGQIEVVFTLLFSRFYLKERLQLADTAGLLLVVGGVVLIVVGGR